jgi:hypothetical protein
MGSQTRALIKHNAHEKINFSQSFADEHAEARREEHEIKSYMKSAKLCGKLRETLRDLFFLQTCETLLTRFNAL